MWRMRPHSTRPPHSCSAPRRGQRDGGAAARSVQWEAFLTTMVTITTHEKVRHTWRITEHGCMARIHLTDQPWILLQPLRPTPVRTGRPRAGGRRTIEATPSPQSVAVVGATWPPRPLVRPTCPPPYTWVQVCRD